MTLALIPPDDIRLRQRAHPVRRVRKPMRDFFDALYAVMANSGGIGIAAPQVGLDLRVCVIRDAQRTEARTLFMANPVVAWASREMVWSDEGCLSFPDQVFRVRRHSRVTVQYLDRTNECKMVPLDGVAAICAQHEIDHLDGVLAHMRAADRVAP